MPTTDDNGTGTQLSPAGSENRQMTVRSDRVPDLVVLQAQLAPPSQTVEHRRAIRDAIVGPLAAMTNLAGMGEKDRAAAFKFWLDALARFRVDEVEKAFIDFTSTKERYPNPQTIVGLIDAARGKVAYEIAQVRRLEAQAAQTKQGNPLVLDDETKARRREEAERVLSEVWRGRKSDVR